VIRRTPLRHPREALAFAWGVILTVALVLLFLVV